MEEIATPPDWWELIHWPLVWIAITGATLGMLLGWEHYRKNNPGSTTAKFFEANWQNVLFHYISAIFVLTFGDQVVFAIITSFWEIPISTANKIEYTIAGLCGLGGGFIVAKLWGIFNKK